MKITLLTLLIASTCFADSVADARSAMNRGELVNAEQILNAAINETQAKLGRNAPQLDSALELLAQVYQREKRYADAATLQQWRIDIWSAVAGEQQGVVLGRVLHQLSVVQRQAGNLPDAEAASRRALAIMTAAYLDNPPAAQAAADLADILIAENRIDEAEHMLAFAEKTFDTAVGPTSPLTTGIAVRRAAVLKQLGRPAAPPPNTSAATIYRVGGTVTAPRILSKVEPQYSEEARKNKLQGTISMSMVVDATGAPTQIAILYPLGMGLDQEAINAVSQWRFSPGTRNGAPVPVFTQIEVSFHTL
jgi:TonB family protein